LILAAWYVAVTSAYGMLAVWASTVATSAAFLIFVVLLLAPAVVVLRRRVGRERR